MAADLALEVFGDLTKLFQYRGGGSPIGGGSREIGRRGEETSEDCFFFFSHATQYAGS